MTAAHPDSQGSNTRDPGDSRSPRASSEIGTDALPGPGAPADTSAALPRFYALRRSLETGEAYWFWTLGKWDVGAGFFKGFGLGFTVQKGECDVTLGPFSIGGVRE